MCPPVGRQQALQAEIGLSIVDEFFLPSRHSLGSVFHWREVKGLPHVTIACHTANAESEIFAQHWD